MGSSLFIILDFVRGARDWVGSIDVKGSFFGIFFGFLWEIGGPGRE